MGLFNVGGLFHLGLFPTCSALKNNRMEIFHPVCVEAGIVVVHV